MRALVSVYDKTGVVEFAQQLVGVGCEIISSGGTAATLASAGVPVVAVDDVTGGSEMLDGRVKTLHPAIHGAILADRAKPDHMAQLVERGLEPIDLVVCNLYPFGSDPGVELIDIGGPAMVRAAAKNFGTDAGGVAVLVDPADYSVVLDELRARGGVSTATRRRLAARAFAHTQAYDAEIVAWFDTEAGADADERAERDAGLPDGPPDGLLDRLADRLPDRLTLSLERAEVCRYGENPHQQGARYREVGTSPFWDRAVQHNGPALSYLNYFDADAAWRIAHDLAASTGDVGGDAAVVIVKHANPCGAAVGDDLADTYARAYACDERSAFGGIVAFSQAVDLATVERVEAAAQADVIIAPGYEDGAVERLAARRANTRVLEAPGPDGVADVHLGQGGQSGSGAGLHLRHIGGGWLVQSAQSFASAPVDWQVVTQRQPTEAELADARFAWRVCGHVSSNAIVLAAGGTAWGIGAGQQNRVESAQLAASKAAGRAAGGACASDAFYPFADGVEAAAEAGVAVVVQPGGSVRDPDVIARADELGLAMLFTAERQFKH